MSEPRYCPPDCGFKISGVKDADCYKCWAITYGPCTDFNELRRADREKQAQAVTETVRHIGNVKVIDHPQPKPSPK